MSRIPALRKLPLIVAGLFAASSAFAAPLQTEVRDAQGQLMPSTMVWVVTPAGAEVTKTITDAKGIAHFANIAPGHYLVEIRGSRGQALSKPIDISGTDVIKVEIAMDAPPTAPAAPTAKTQTQPKSSSPAAPAAVSATPATVTDGVNATPEGQAPESVQITTTRLKSERADLDPKVGTTVYQIDSRMIDALGQGDDTPFNEVLLRLPGVDQDSKASGSLHVRDDHGNVQYRIDGVLLPENISGFGQSVDTRFVQQVDFVTGALPAQYGLRTAGIVDIQTKDGDVAPGGQVGILVGGHNYYEPSAEFFGNDGKFSYYLSASFLSNSLGIENPLPTANALHDNTTQGKTFGNLSYYLDSDTRVGLMFGTYSGEFQIPDNPSQTAQFTLNGLSNAATGYSAIPSSAINETQSEVNRFFVLSFQKSVGDLNYQASVFHQYSNLHYTPDPVADMIYLGTASDTMRSNSADGLQFDASYKLSANHTLRAGVEYTRQNTASDNTVEVFPATAQGVQTGTVPFNIVDNSSQLGVLESVYLQDEWHISDPLTVNYGIRHDQVQAFTDEQQWSPRFNLLYKISDATALHAGVSRYFTPPPQELASQKSISLYANTTNTAPCGQTSAYVEQCSNGVAVSDPVRAERTNYFDLGLSQKVGSNLTLTADAYYKKITNLIDEGQFGQALILSPFNYQMGYAKGLELSAILDQRNWGAFLNVTGQKAQGEHIISGQATFSPDELTYIASHYIYLDHDQKLSISSGAHYKFGDSQVSTDLIYGSGLRNTPPGGAPNSTELPGYTTVNAAFTHTWKKTMFGTIEGRLALINIFDKSYLLRDGTGVGVGAPQYGAPRTFYAGISSNF